MKRKIEFDNVFSLHVFDDIVSEINAKYPHIIIELNKEKFYFIINLFTFLVTEYHFNSNKKTPTELCCGCFYYKFFNLFCKP